MSPSLVQFERPVTILVGLGFPRQVDNAVEACSLLQDMAATYHGPSQGAAVKACRAAMAGEIDAETARGVFEAFARSKGILLNGPVAAAAMAAKRDLLGA